MISMRGSEREPAASGAPVAVNAARPRRGLRRLGSHADADQYFMAGVALGFALETPLLTYLLVEFGDDNGGELEIPDSVSMSDLIEAANHFEVLNAPIDGPSHVREDDRPPKHVAREVVDIVRKFRNLIHPGRALRERYDPRRFAREDFENLKEVYESIAHSLMYYL